MVTIMNWEALTAIGQLVAAVGVIASVLYLAIQVRDQARASEVQAKLTTTRLLTDFMDGLTQLPELNRIRLKGVENFGALSPEEQVQFTNISLKAFWFLSAVYFQVRHKTIRDEDWFEVRAVMRIWLHGAGCRAWWAGYGHKMFAGAFVNFVEAEIAGIEAAQAKS